MKIKPIYIYLGTFVIVIIALVVMTSGGNPSTSSMGTPQEQTMPKDDIHQNLGNAPGSGNVSSEFKQKMANLKSGYENNPADTVNAKEYARLLAAAHKPQEALDVYNGILEINPERVDIRLELATVYYNLKRFSEAKRETEIVLKKNPDSPGVEYNLGAIEAALGNPDKAKEIWEKVISEYPNSEAARIANTSLQNLK